MDKSSKETLIGKDKHTCEEAVYIPHLQKKLFFHVMPNSFHYQKRELLVSTSRTKNKHFITNESLYLGGRKLKLADKGYVVDKNIIQISAIRLPTIRIDDILDQLERAKLFFAFDIGTGFYKIPMKEKCKKYSVLLRFKGILNIIECLLD